MKKIPLTTMGAEKLREELERLKRVERPRIISAIAEARAHGDLKENAEYHAAKEQQSFVEGRIVDVEGKLSLAQIIDVTRHYGATPMRAVPEPYFSNLTFWLILKAPVALVPPFSLIVPQDATHASASATELKG